MGILTIAVGSENPAKLRAAELAISPLFPLATVIVRGVPVVSGVSNNPLTDDESIRGALNRAQAAQAQLNADFGVGMEGGLCSAAGLTFECGWIAVVDKTGRVGLGSSGRFQVSDKIAEKIKSGLELGQVMDQQKKSLRRSQHKNAARCNGNSDER